jgi:predicted aconitase with swiveling domain
VLGEPDDIIAIGSLVASELYGASVPVVLATAGAFAKIHDGHQITIP